MGSTRVDTVAIWGVDILGSDSIFNDTIRATGIALPLNYTRDETDITFRLVGSTNTMKLGYQSRTQFVSEDCGSRYELSDLELLEYNFDSARLVNTRPGKSASNNVEVFRCPVPNILTLSFRDLYVSGTKGTSKFGGVVLSGINADFTGTVFYPDARTATVYLPVNVAADQSTYTFHFASGKQAQVAVNYTRTTEERYAQCGTQTFITELAITDASFDSASIVVGSDKIAKTTLLDPHEANLYLYSCPQTNLAKFNFRTRTSSTASRTDTVFLKSVTADYTATIFYSDVAVTSITVPVNPDATTTTFTLEYTDKTEVISLNYTRHTPTTLFNVCGPQPLFSDLVEGTDVENVAILKTDSLQFPAVSNLEIYHN